MTNIFNQSKIKKSKIKSFIISAMLLGSISGCSIVQSLNTTRVEQIDVNAVKVTALATGLLTIASSEVITKFYGANTTTCVLSDTFKGPDHGIICRDVPVNFTLNLNTLGKVAARVSQ